MSSTVSYKGSTLTTVNNQTRVLGTKGKWLEDDITIVDVTQGGGGTPSATAHTIYFEFSDNTNATITAYYDDSFISSAITATTPSTYGGKTVDSASLDGVEWYVQDDYETLYDNALELDNYGDVLYGAWLGTLASTEVSDGELWRVTISGTTYNCTAEDNALNVSGDWAIRLDGLSSGCMFYYFNPSSPNITLKIERKVTA